MCWLSLSQAQVKTYWHIDMWGGMAGKWIPGWMDKMN